MARASYLDADTATDAKLLGQRGYLRCGRHFDAQLAHAHHWTGLLALLPTALRFAFVIADNGNTRLLVRLLVLLPARHAVNSKMIVEL